jgi:hypothetical protein
MRRAVVLRLGGVPVDATLGALAAAGFEAVAINRPGELRAQVEAGAAAVVLADAEAERIVEQFAVLATMPPALRRGCVVLAVAPGFVTGDGLRAFTLGADMVVSPQDLPQLGELVSAAAACKRMLVAPLDAAAAARLGP